MNKYALNYLPEAHEDLYGIIAYIAQELHNPEAAKKLHEEILEALDTLCCFPASAPPSRYPQLAEYGIRQLEVKNYCIMYFVDNEIESIVIVYIKYAKQNLSKLAMPNSANE